MIEIPKQCPVCDSQLERVNDQLFCRNITCEAKTSKKLQHFCKVMKIKGLGEKTLEKLDLEDIPDLYRLSLEDLTETLGQKIGTKIFTEVAQSKEVPLATFIQAFGIPLIGNSAASKISNHIDSIWNITEKVCKDAGLGEKATDNLVNWIESNEDKYSSLPINPKVKEVIKVTEIYKVCITGKLIDFKSRNEAKQFLESKGVTVQSNVSSKTNYLVCDNQTSTSSSFVKAEKLNIPIITMNEFLNIINGEN